jgi:SAM-dependent methyltransferase
MSTKQMQGKLWSVAPAYWSQHFEPYFLPLYKKVLDTLKPSEETSVLDAGCGSGLFSSMVIGRGAELIGIDAAPGLLKVARLRNPQHNFLEEDLEALPFKDNCFDVVTGFNSFQYAGDFEKALLESKRVLRPGGKLVIAIWDKPELNEATTILKAIGSLLPPPRPGTPGPFALSEDGRVEGILSKIGLRLQHRFSVPCPMLFVKLGDAVKSFMGTGPAAMACNHVEEAHVRDVVAKAFAPYKVAEDFYHLRNQFLLFIAEKVS